MPDNIFSRISNKLRTTANNEIDNIVYICKKPLHANSRHTKFALALSKTKYNIYYINPLRMKEYIFYKFANADSEKKYGNLKYHPYLRISQKFKSYELKKIIGILSEHDLLNQITYVISADMDFCLYLKENVPYNVKVVYYIIDRYSEYDKRTEEEKLRFDQRENEIIKKCDLVLCASQKLLSESKVLNNQSFWLPNAVPDNQIVNAEHKGTKGKIGMISDELSRIDWPLICKIAQQLEHYTIELIGTNDLPSGIKYPDNIRIIGYVPFNQLGIYANEWHAGLALYEKNRFNEYCCPLKYFEYAAFNIPTISTTIPEAKVWADLYPNCVYLADEAPQVAERLRDIVENDQFIDYIRMAKENTWSIRAQQLCKIFETFSNHRKSDAVSE